MKTRTIATVAIATLLATIAGTVAALGAARSAIGPVRVEIVSVRALDARDSGRNVVDAGSAASTGREVVQGHDLLRELQREFRLTVEQRSDLDGTLRELAGLQAQIDGVPDARQRDVWQEELVRELIAALRDVVGDRGLETTLAKLAAKQPRLVYESAP